MQPSTALDPTNPDTVSVVIPAFNAASFIAAALDSIAAQTLLPMEVIVVDDGSVDSTAEAVRSWRDAVERPFRVVLSQQPNRGVPSARNIGIRHASGQWVALLDADDIWHLNHLQALLDAVRAESGSVAAYGAGRVVDADEPAAKLYDDMWDSPSKRFGEPIEGDAHGRLKVDFRAFERLVVGNFIKPSSLIFSRQCALEVGLFDEGLRSAEDREFLVRLLRRGSFIYIPEAITTYCWHANNLGHDKHARRNAENGLYAIHLIRNNRALQLSADQDAACALAILAGAKEYLYLSAREGWAGYREGLRFLQRTFGIAVTLTAFKFRHIAVTLRSRVQKAAWING